jgi:hypothetical protein
VLNHARVLVPTVALATACAGLLTGGASAEEVEAQRVSLERRIHDDDVRESSGLARSTFNRPLLWTHNDSGDRPRIFAIKRNGSTKGVLNIRGASFRDWEDMAYGPRHSLWIADIGDNGRARDYVTVYKVREPRKVSSRSVPSKRYDFRYPDGAHDAEGLIVRPRTGRVFIVSKSRDGGALYRAPKRLSTTSTNKLKKVRSVPVSITAAAWRPGGFVLTNHNFVYVYKSMKSAPRTFRKPHVGQGESLEVARNARSVLLGAEGRNSPVYRMTLR